MAIKVQQSRGYLKRSLHRVAVQGTGHRSWGQVGRRKRHRGHARGSRDWSSFPADLRRAASNPTVRRISGEAVCSGGEGASEIEWRRLSNFVDGKIVCRLSDFVEGDIKGRRRRKLSAA